MNQNSPEAPPIDPYNLFEQWFKEAEKTEHSYHNSMAVAGISPDGKPNVRIVLLRGVSEDGFHFYTNYESDKGRSFIENPVIEANFYWKSTQKQIRINGAVEKLSPAQSDEYFAGRPRGSQIGAWASDQSRTLKTYENFERRIQDFENKFKDMDAVPRPPHWGGFIIKPEKIEFWEEKPFRLHHRFVYTKRDQKNWDINWLYP